MEAKTTTLSKREWNDMIARATSDNPLDRLVPCPVERQRLHRAARREKARAFARTRREGANIHP